jgi:hypothetical protein
LFIGSVDAIILFLIPLKKDENERQDAKSSKKNSKTHGEERITSSGMGAPPMILFSNEEHGRGAHATHASGIPWRLGVQVSLV